MICLGRGSLRIGKGKKEEGRRDGRNGTEQDWEGSGMRWCIEGTLREDWSLALHEVRPFN